MEIWCTRLFELCPFSSSGVSTGVSPNMIGNFLQRSPPRSMISPGAVRTWSWNSANNTIFPYRNLCIKIFSRLTTRTAQPPVESAHTDWSIGGHTKKALFNWREKWKLWNESRLGKRHLKLTVCTLMQFQCSFLRRSLPLFSSTKH